VKFLNLRGSLQNAFNVGVLTGETSQSIQDSGSISTAGAISFVDSPQALTVESQVDALQNQDGRFETAIQFLGQRPDGVAIAFAGNVLFISGSADLTPDGIALMGELAEVLKTIPNDVRVEGHTDDIPPGSEKFPSNWELSAGRAVTIARYLEEAGVSPFRLSAFGYGQYRPVAPNDSTPNRNRNRRAEIVILNPSVDLVGPVR
jgi:chemotaxis protein MotB